MNQRHNDPPDVIKGTKLSRMLHNLTRPPRLMDVMIVIIIMTGVQFHRLIDMPAPLSIYYRVTIH